MQQTFKSASQVSQKFNDFYSMEGPQQKKQINEQLDRLLS